MLYYFRINIKIYWFVIDFFNGCWERLSFFWLNEWCWMWGCFWDGGFVVDFLNFFLKLVIFDLMFGEVFKFLVLFFISFSNICVFLSLFVFVVFFLFGGGYWFELLVIFVGGFMLLNCCLVGSVWVWLFEWVFLIFGVIGMEWYIVGLVFFLFIEEEDDECMVFMMIDVLYFMLDVLLIFFLVWYY